MSNVTRPRPKFLTADNHEHRSYICWLPVRSSQLCRRRHDRADLKLAEARTDKRSQLMDQLISNILGNK
jgi:hypothetical protein